MNTHTDVAILGLGRIGSAMAERLSQTHSVRTWSRSQAQGPTAAQVVAGADVVLLCLYDAAACREVLEACRPELGPGTTVVNTATVGPEEAAELSALVSGLGADYVHAPVVGSVPAALAGELTVLTGPDAGPTAAEVLDRLGRRVSLAGAREAAAAKLLANGVLADTLLTLRRSLRLADSLDLSRPTALDVLASTALGPVVRVKRPLLEQPGHVAAGAQFTAGALMKDLALLSRATGSTPWAVRDLDVLLATGAVGADDDVAAVATADLEVAGVDIAADVVAAPEVLRPLLAYARGHATGDPAHFRDAFLPTAHVEGHRDGVFTSWGLDEYVALFAGQPADDEPVRRRQLESVDVHGRVGTARMTLWHGADTFTDAFVLVRTPEGEWRIANKVYERRDAQAVPGTSTSPV
ncbi:nuclear transport factor 2 family protein [Nocardioides sp. T2.26MG-1]|uniref:nuclear transport factor 2 family protein n=1 Tax=Nocardioides sp. T2.26MG-1 TaxID=3041166 RepID=UPI0024775582|nr:nuclear transport factor 2 family protein [Nocardioides sp. T2.26MG-1]CAI9399834.1 3-sulfolactaldehyde reductase [Nocardioides sp. T2.26MG-1]